MSTFLNILAWIAGSIAAVCWVLGGIYVGACALAELVDGWDAQPVRRAPSALAQGDPVGSEAPNARSTFAHVACSGHSRAMQTERRENA